MVVTRNSGLSENIRASKKILRDIKSGKSLRPRISNPNYREESPDERGYSILRKILKVNVNNKKPVSHKLKFQSSNQKKTFKKLHPYKLITSDNNHKDGSQVNNVDKDNSASDNESKAEINKSCDEKMDVEERKDTIDDPGINEEKVQSDAISDTKKLEINKTNNVKKNYLFNSNKNNRSFKSRISTTFSRLPEIDSSQKCYESGRRYPSRLRRQPRDVYKANLGYKNDKRSNWYDSLTSPIQSSSYNASKHRKLELHSKQSDTDDSDELAEDEIKFESRKQKSFQRARSELNPINLSTNECKLDLFRERNLARVSLADIEPMRIDPTINFSMIGGNKKFIQSLKESVILPLVYPEVFQKLSISPPRGLLFYGPPGSGKTLLARALVNECNGNNSCKLSFFMRKGADCLSKWVGESERQLRLLFDQAYRMRPSIIFFDEIDGLAPVRSVRQDQIHSSIVSTLLSLIDGLDDRGEIIVIGATNRIDSIDPALRRPGRFDREFMFTLPEENERKDIIKIHTRDWKPPLSNEIISKIASVTKGFSGADIKALVVESGLCALRRRYPQIYQNRKKLELNLNEIFIKEEDFRIALKTIRPSNERSTFSFHSLIPVRIKLLLNQDYWNFKEKVSNFFPDQVFPSEMNTIDNDMDDLLSIHLKPHTEEISSIFKPHLLVSGFAIDQLVLGLFHEISNVNILTFDSLCLGINNGLSAEEKLCQIFREAEKTSKTIVFFPHIDITFHSLSLSGQNLLLQMIRSHNSNPELYVCTVLILTTLSNGASDSWWNVEFDNVQSNSIWSELGKSFQASVIQIKPPNFEQRKTYFSQLIQLATKPINKIAQLNSGVNPQNEILREVEIKPPVLTEQEIKKLEVEEDNIMRKFRMVLRKILASLVKERKFQIFLNPVDITEVPDYYDIISNPIDLSTMRQKVDLYNYNTFEEFKNDLQLITSNALLYNPPKNSYLKDIRRHAYEFNDIAESIFEDHWSPEFENIVRTIHESRLKRNYYDKVRQTITDQREEVREFLVDLNGSKFDIANGPLFRTQLELYDKFYKCNGKSRTNVGPRQQSDNEVFVKKSTLNTIFRKTKSVSNLNSGNVNEDECKTMFQSFKALKNSLLKENTHEPMAVDSNGNSNSNVIHPSDCSPPDEEPIQIDLLKLNQVIEQAAQLTDCSSMLQLEELYYLLSKKISKFTSRSDRSTLSEDLHQIIDDYFQKS